MGESWKAPALAVSFGLALLLANRHLRARIPATIQWYFAYGLIATAASLLLLEPGPALLRVSRLLLALTIPVLLWGVWTRDPTLLLRAHFWAYGALLILTIVGIVLDPAYAWSGASSFADGGRLRGALLPLQSPRVGEIAAVTLGLTVIGWAFGRNRWWLSLPIGAIAFFALIASRTRTAAAALLVALLVAVILTWGFRGGRRLAGVLAVPIGVAGLAAASVVSWFVRGQELSQLQALTGRTTAWAFVLEEPLAIQTVIFGHGLGVRKVLLTRGEGDINTMPIDNAWLSVFWETGLIGLVVVVLAALVTLWTAVRAPTPYVRATTTFLTVYVIISSLSETGLSDLSTQTLTLVVAGTVASVDRWVRPRGPAAAGIPR